MTIEIADRLCAYRKNAGFSQEELAEKIGVSRQAVSKWERAEASPDTDNLILLAKIYEVTLDDLLNKDPVEPAEEPSADQKPEDHIDKEENTTNGDTAHISLTNGIHIRSKNGDNVRIDWRGVHVDSANGEHVDVSFNGIHVEENGHVSIFSDGDTVHFVSDHEDDEEEKIPESYRPFRKRWHDFPFWVIAALAFFLLGFFNIWGGWATSWIMLITIPIYYSIGDMIAKRDISEFCYPCLITIIYLYLGFLQGLWHPMWILFITIPIYYWIGSFFKPRNTDYRAK